MVEPCSRSPVMAEPYSRRSPARLSHFSVLPWLQPCYACVVEPCFWPGRRAPAQGRARGAKRRGRATHTQPIPTSKWTLSAQPGLAGRWHRAQGVSAPHPGSVWWGPSIARASTARLRGLVGGVRQTEAIVATCQVALVFWHCLRVHQGCGKIERWVAALLTVPEMEWSPRPRPT